MAELQWFPYDVDDWEERIQKMGLSAEEEGLLMRLCRGAWRSELPATLTGKPDELARLVGAQWKKALPILKTNFAPVDEHPGMLRCAWLAELHEKQLAKHRSYSSRGQLGGLRAQAGKKAEPAPKPAIAQAELGKKEAELPKNGGSASEAFTREGKEGVSSSPSDYRANTLVEKDIAHARTAPGPGGPRGRGGENDPYKAADLQVHSEAARRDSEARLLAEEYLQELFASVDRWRSSHPREYEHHRVEVIKTYGLMGREINAKQQASIDAEVAVRIQREQKWLTRTQWIGNKQRGKIQPMGEAIAG